MGFFKKTKGLPALEKRLLDAVQKQENLKNAKEQLLADLLHAQDSGSDVTSINARLTDVRSDIELVEKEISLLKDDVREHCRLEAEKEVAAIPERKALFEEQKQRLIDEANEKFARSVQVYSALGSEYSPPGLTVVGPKMTAMDADVLGFIAERSALGAISIPQGTNHILNKKLADTERRIGVKLRG